MSDSFMARPTDVLVSYLAQSTGMTEAVVRRTLRTGRIAMGMEILTVMRLLEDHQLMTEHEAMVSCLQTLLIDQGLAEDAMVWYGNLSEWRKPKLVPDSSQIIGRDADASDLDAQPSEHEAPQAAPAPDGSTLAQPGNGRSSDPSSSG
jgi:hypothetical protein